MLKYCHTMTMINWLHYHHYSAICLETWPLQLGPKNKVIAQDSFCYCTECRNKTHPVSVFSVYTVVSALYMINLFQHSNIKKLQLFLTKMLIAVMLNNAPFLWDSSHWQGTKKCHHKQWYDAHLKPWSPHIWRHMERCHPARCKDMSNIYFIHKSTTYFNAS